MIFVPASYFAMQQHNAGASCSVVREPASCAIAAFTADACDATCVRGSAQVDKFIQASMGWTKGGITAFYSETLKIKFICFNALLDSSHECKALESREKTGYRLQKT
jgi:hypothetical protein